MKYKQIKYGDIIKNGDEYLNGDFQTWSKMDGSVGYPYLQHEFLAVRRPVEEKPTVQTAGEIADKWRTKDTEDGGTYYYKCSNEAFKAGQKSERNAHAEFVEAAQDFLELTGDDTWKVLKSALQNLKKYYKETE